MLKKRTVYIICAVFFILKAAFDGFRAFNSGLTGEDVFEKIFSGAVGSILIIVIVLVAYFIRSRKSGDNS